MGKFSNGIFGNFYGKIGNVVGSNWRGIDYLRSLPKVNKNRVPTQSQVEQQMRFALMTAFLTSIRQVIDIGYKNQAIGATAYNVALSDNIKTAIAGSYPSFEVDYPAVTMSRGVLPLPSDMAAAAASGRLVNWNWTDNSGKGKALNTDKVVALAFCPETGESEYDTVTATRGIGALSLIMPASWVGKEVENYLFFISANGKEISGTFYGGKVVILA